MVGIRRALIAGPAGGNAGRIGHFKPAVDQTHRMHKTGTVTVNVAGALVMAPALLVTTTA